MQMARPIVTYYHLSGTFLGVECRHLDPLGPLGFECAQHRPTPRHSVERIRRKAQLLFGSQ